MKYFLFIFIFLLVGCGPSQNVSPSPETPATTSSPPTATNTVVPAFTATIPPSLTPIILPPTLIPCDPYIADYCITGGHFILQRPIQPPEENIVDPTYRYASTANGTRDPHHGVEMGKDYGAPVYAASDGVVVFAGPDKAAVYSLWPNFYGNMIVIHHGDNLFTLYAHLSKVDVTAEQAVKVGEKIGEIGQSGAATGSHLHFEVRRGEVENYLSTVNPELWLMPSSAEHGAVSLAIFDEARSFQSGKLTLQHYSDSNEILEAYYVDTYDSRMPVYEENAALSDLPAGRYRITLIHNGHLYERWVEVQSGKLTQVVIVVK